MIAERMAVEKAFSKKKVVRELHVVAQVLRLGSLHQKEKIVTRLLQLAAFSFRTIKYWSGFAGNFLSPTSKCSANKIEI
jgi:hypothetical protein